MRKYIRKRKSELRRQYIDLGKQQEAIKEFLGSLEVEKK